MIHCLSKVESYVKHNGAVPPHGLFGLLQRTKKKKYLFIFFFFLSQIPSVFFYVNRFFCFEEFIFSCEVLKSCKRPNYDGCPQNEKKKKNLSTNQYTQPIT
uniref:Uncharacterized protein n=1 Tax=Cacopsylla melanoneura TaxID=428564 RepID=A0A8D8Y3L8_9HEMI